MLNRVILVSILFFVAFCAQAQYSVNKLKYNHHLYIRQPGDPYNPGAAGFASFILPGLGQMVSGEVGRGLGFLAGEVGFYIILSSGRIGPIGLIVVPIWSIIDAVKVAKVNNMAFRDMNQSTLKFRIEPTNITLPGQGVNPGLSFRLTF